MPGREPSLYLQEEILLLALRDEAGTVAADHTYHFALGGAILSELLLGNRIAIDEGRSRDHTAGFGAWLRQAFTEKNLVDLADNRPLGDPLLDECLGRIATAKRRASMKTWITRFAHVGKLQHRIAEGLCRRGVIRADTGTILLIFKRRIYPELDPRPERAVIERLRKAIFTDTREIDPRTVVLISLADSAGVLRIPFGRRELRARRKRIEQITSGELMGKATKQAIQAAQAAVATAACVPVIVAATASN